MLQNKHLQPFTAGGFLEQCVEVLLEARDLRLSRRDYLLCSEVPNGSGG